MSSKTEALEYLLEKARGVVMTPVELEEQRRSFAYGNAAIENSLVTRAMVDREAEKLAQAQEPQR
jgi:phosphoglucomutase